MLNENEQELLNVLLSDYLDQLEESLLDGAEVEHEIFKTKELIEKLNNRRKAKDG